MGIFRPRCRHAWKVTGATFEPPRHFEELTGAPRDVFRELVYGFTVLTQQCEECGWVSTSKELGRVDLKGQGKLWPSQRAG